MSNGATITLERLRELSQRKHRAMVMRDTVAEYAEACGLAADELERLGVTVTMETIDMLRKEVAELRGAPELRVSPALAYAAPVAADAAAPAPAELPTTAAGFAAELERHRADLNARVARMRELEARHRHACVVEAAAEARRRAKEEAEAAMVEAIAARTALEADEASMRERDF